MTWSVWLKKFDWVLLALALAIVVLGALTFYQSGAREEEIFRKQLLFSLAGAVLMISVSFADYRIFKNYSAASVILYAISIIFLLAALGFSPVRGARSWIILGGYGFQPSEFTKLTLLVLLAKYFSQKHAEIYRWHHILASGVYAAAPAWLTLLQPDFGSTMVFVALWLAMLFFSGIKRRHLLTILMVGLMIFSFAWFLAFKPYQKDRIFSFLNPYLDPRGIGYNVIQSQTTFGSGRIWGTFFDNSKNLTVLVPERYTDFAFAAYGQKFGFAGVVLLLGLLAGLSWRLGAVAARVSNNFARLYILGLMTVIIIHSFSNAGMNLGVLPITGIPFSFLSYGGSHLLTLMVGLGVVESIKIRS
ncbi:MAG: FtsW/RodA/SpoVE family cell cycle protein [Patescibacteria group bacterium]